MIWNSSDWPRSHDFYPFQIGRANFFNSSKGASSQPATVLGKLTPAYHFDGTNVFEVSQGLFIIDAGVVSTFDIAPD